MPAERLSMRQIRDVLRLRFASKLSQRAIAKSLRLSQGAVSTYLTRARAAGIVWPLPDDLDDAQLEALLYPPAPAIAADQRPMPDWAWVHRELRRPDVTLALLWEEYRAGAPDGFGYSWYCDLYRAWAGRLKPTMRQTHIAGEKLFVDFRRPHRRGRRWPHRRDHPGADLCRRIGQAGRSVAAPICSHQRASRSWLIGRAEDRTYCKIVIIWRLSALDLVARNIWTPAPQFCGLKHDMSGTRGKCRCRRFALRLKAGESLAVEFVECLNRAAEIGAAVDPIS